MIIAPHEIHNHVKGNAICRNSAGQAIFTLTPDEIRALAALNWIEGKARRGSKDSKGVRSIDITHVTLVVSTKEAVALLDRRPATKIRSGRLKAEGSKTWIQTGPTSYQPHLQRCYAFADNAVRIGIVRA